MSEHLKNILESVTSQGYRSNVVKPLMGVMVICGIGSIVAFYYEAEILAFVFIGLVCFTVIAFVVAYYICLFRNPDLLRSERYNLEKTAIEKATIKGDSTNICRIQIPGNDYLLINGNNNREEGQE